MGGTETSTLPSCTRVAIWASGRYYTGDVDAALPSSAKRPPWQGQSKVRAGPFHCNRHPMWVQTPESAEKPDSVWRTKPTMASVVKRLTPPSGMSCTAATATHTPEPLGTRATDGWVLGADSLARTNTAPAAKPTAAAPIPAPI